MADELFPKLLLMATFFGVTTLLLIKMVPIIQSGAMYNDPSMNWGEIGISSNFMQPNPFVVTNASVKDRWDQYGSPSQTFTSASPHRHDVDAWVVRNNTWYDPGFATSPFHAYLNCIIFWQDYGIFNLDERYASISYEDIESKANSGTNVSKYTFPLNADYELFVGTGPGYTFQEALWYNEFNMSVGWSVNWSEEPEPSPWGVAGQILTFSVPHVNPTVQALIAIPMYCTMGFVFIAILTRFFPTVPGL